MAKKKMNFGSETKYRKWLKYGHATGVFEETPGNVDVTIKGKPHKVKHGK